MICSGLFIDLFMTCFYVFLTCLQISNLNSNSSQLIHNLLRTCSIIFKNFQDLLLTCPWLVDGLLMTCKTFSPVYKYIIWEVLLHNLFMICSELVCLNYFIWCTKLELSNLNYLHIMILFKLRCHFTCLTSLVVLLLSYLT